MKAICLLFYTFQITNHNCDHGHSSLHAHGFIEILNMMVFPIIHSRNRRQSNYSNGSRRIKHHCPEFNMMGFHINRARNRKQSNYSNGMEVGE